jgi:hypothetical protein
LKNGKILCEYDFLQRRLLDRNEALDKRELKRTFYLLGEFFKGNYDPNEKLSRQNGTMVRKHDSEGIIQKIFNFLKSIVKK